MQGVTPEKHSVGCIIHPSAITHLDAMHHFCSANRFCNSERRPLNTVHPEHSATSLTLPSSTLEGGTELCCQFCRWVFYSPATRVSERTNAFISLHKKTNYRCLSVPFSQCIQTAVYIIVTCLQSKKQTRYGYCHEKKMAKATNTESKA